MRLKSFLLVGLCSLFFSKSSAINLPYEVQETLLRLLTKKDLQSLDTSSRSVVPIYRKDLDTSYIAYYQIDDHGKRFYVLATGPRTGDHKVAQSGPAPLPTKVLSIQAKKAGQVCSKFFLLSSMGLYMCENKQGRAVAATYNWIADSPVTDWKRLQKMVEKSLVDFKRAWKKVAASSREEWKTSQRKPLKQKPGLRDYDAEIVSPGSTAKVALEKNHGKITIHAIPSGRQSQLCKILVSVCRNHGKADVNQDLIHKTKSGINFLEFQVEGNRNYVRKVLGNKEISFYFKIDTKDGSEQVLKYFSVDLSRHRRRRWTPWRYWRVANDHLFPQYSQHSCCGCESGCGPVAWAQILAFYDRLAHRHPSSGYSKRFWSCTDGTANHCMAPSRMNRNVQKYVEGIRSKLGTFCLFGGGATTPSGMKNIINWYRARGIGGRIYRHYHTFSWSGWTRDWIRDRAAGHIKAGYPAIVGIWVKGSKKKAMHYAVATRYAERKEKYRKCFLWWCRNKTRYQKSFKLHMGWGGSSNGWYTIHAYAAFAARKY